MPKRIFAFIICTAVLILNCLPAYAAGFSTEEMEAESALLMELSSGQVIFEKDMHKKVAPASITKLMTMLLVMEELSSGRMAVSDMLTCSEYASHMGGSEIWLEEGEQMSVDDLLKAVFVASANDAAVVFAEQIAGTEDEFVRRMNLRAQEMGLEHTNFVNCTGFDEDGHYTCAFDIAQLARKLMEYPLVKEYTTIWMDTLRSGKTELTNTNRLVRFYQGITGLKTGHTDNAGSCLCATAQRGNLNLISVVMKCPSADIRNKISRQLLDYGFANYEFAAPPPADEQLTPLKVLHGTEPFAQLYCDPPPGILLPKGSSTRMEQFVILDESAAAPLERDSIVGRVEVFAGDEKLLEYPVRVKQTIPEMTFSRALMHISKQLLNLK
ncbi:MAG: D-alanyl-D-alanine carboxypeptidase [Oscillospiraceae bacterium]|nr:D-alanyl-D-alanine carboxypeptidase [Oscillospiraceae bacterium]